MAAAGAASTTTSSISSAPMTTAALSASPSSADHNTYTRPSTTATRAMIDTPTDSPTHSGTATPSDPASPYGTLHRKKTNNYESAIADRVAPASTSEAESADAQGTGVRVVGSTAYRGDAAVASGAGNDASRPGGLGRQQSWNHDDVKRNEMQKLLNESEKKGGYSSTG